MSDLLKNKTISEDDLDQFIISKTPYLLSWARKFERNTEKQKDLVQEVLTHAVEKKHTLRNINNKTIKSWLYKMLKNKFVDTVRLEKRMKEANSAYSLKYSLLGSDADELSDQLFFKKELRALLNQLSQNQRLPLLMFYYRWYTYQEISDALDISIHAVRTRISNAKIFLRNNIQK